ncbi:MAG: hypothetical protein IPJ41_06290 [Phycisphaerales bacterium]|nr:hypothetical protein [Phycisphaerales bacterium]
MRRALRITALAALGVGLGLGALGGCTRNESVGQSGGRINPYASTRADEASTAASMPAMWEYSDQVAEALARRIGQIPEISGAPTRVVVELGSIENETNTPRSDFELIQRRLRGRLLSSDIVNANVRFVESVAQMDAEAKRVRGGDTDPLQRDVSGGQTDRYDPSLTYVLRGGFFESDRGDTRRYYFEFNLVNLQSRTIVFNEPFDLAQQRQ